MPPSSGTWYTSQKGNLHLTKLCLPAGGHAPYQGKPSSMRTCILPWNLPQLGNLHPTRVYLSMGEPASYQAYTPAGEPASYQYTTGGEHESYQGTHSRIGTCILPGNASKLRNLPTTRVYVPAGDCASYQGFHPSGGTCITPGLPGNTVNHRRGTCILPG